MENREIVSIIEALRIRLTELVMEKGTFLDPSVIAISQELDEFIVAYYANPSKLKANSH
ncbi:aspartyl-phosphate phosphatase Spo0E family protein [Paenibacillus turpanensis]|uniref:aspartyl-phosphate phosphatase Spo0E family protein n=1 Tax=Paenibacillus turpanensis TaxID=2689078 RepID=UPI00140C80A6|nr:aspartyl-phosphate phosphatase Spo0E family protein [Paenibacillus turpanensis]